MTPEQVESVAPDAKAFKAGQKLARLSDWKGLGHNDVVVWGLCQGSALYKTVVYLGDLTSKCTCPSRKFPCKHALGLMLLTAAGSVQPSEPPDWVLESLQKRQKAAARKETLQEERLKKAADPKLREKKEKKRNSVIVDGLDQLDDWLNDILTNGIEGLESVELKDWDWQARRLADCQAMGLSNAIREVADSIGKSGWEKNIEASLGRVALASYAFRRISNLETSLQSNLRQFVGVTVSQEEVMVHNDKVEDLWIVLGQKVRHVDNGRQIVTWLVGTRSGRYANIRDFVPDGGGRTSTLGIGTCFEGTLYFWPGAYSLRALIDQRQQGTHHKPDDHSIAHDVQTGLQRLAEGLGANPWLSEVPVVLKNIGIIAREDGIWARESSGKVLPIKSGDHIKLLALSIDSEVTLIGEWNGQYLDPLGVIKDRYYMLSGLE